MKFPQIRYLLYVLLPIALLICFVDFKQMQVSEKYLEKNSIYNDIYIAIEKDSVGKIYLFEHDMTDTYHAYLPKEWNQEERVFFNHCKEINVDGVTLTDGDLLPQFEPDKEYSMKMVGWDDELVDETTVVFYYLSELPNMFISLEEEDISLIRADKEHEAEAIYTVFSDEIAKGKCTISGRGNTSWATQQKPYSINLFEEQSLLGMEKTDEYALLSNLGENIPQIKNKIVYDIARRLDENCAPQCEFVNLFLNGKYHGLYLLSQRVSGGKTIEGITNLEDTNKMLNKDIEYLDTTNKNTSADWKEQYVDDVVNPSDISGGYLLEFDSKFDREKSFFTTDEQRVAVKVPREASEEQVTFIADMVRKAEAAVYSDSGINEITNKSYKEYIDMDSWSKMYVLQNFFVQSDVEYSSFFLYKKEEDPLLYAGPVWDFDLSCGRVYYGDYMATTKNLLWLDTQGYWLKNLAMKKEFFDYAMQQYSNHLSPIISTYLEEDYWGLMESIKESNNIGFIRWSEPVVDFDNKAIRLYDWLSGRREFLDDYYKNPDEYCKVVFCFPWGRPHYYIKRDSELGFLPCDEYGEADMNLEVMGYTDIVGWEDEKGNPVDAGEKITEDREFTAIIK